MRANHTYIDHVGIEREAHALRREVLGAMIESGVERLGRFHAALVATVAAVFQRMHRNADQSFFEAQ